MKKTEISKRLANNLHFGNELSKIIVELKLTPEMASEKLGVYPLTFNDYLHRKKPRGTTLIAKIADTFGK